MSVSRVYRLLRLITMLQSGRKYTAGQLAEELEVSRRTIFRDLNMLELARVPYYYDPEKSGYSINRHFFLPPVNLTMTEALAILTMTGRLRKAHDLPLLGHWSAAATKLQSALPAPMRRHIGGILDKLSVSLGKLSRHEGLDSLFNQLSEAVAQARVCRLVYISFHDRKQIVTNIHPLRVFFISRAWYLLGYAAKYRQVRTFKLGRIKKLTVTDRTFKSPSSFDLDKYFGDAWAMIPEGKLYKVHLHFARKVAANVAEVQWHDTQRVQWNDDGSIEFYVTVDGLGEIMWWTLGYGDQVRVISPAALRNRIQKVAAAMVQQHS